MSLEEWDIRDYRSLCFDTIAANDVLHSEHARLQCIGLEDINKILLFVHVVTELRVKSSEFLITWGSGQFCMIHIKTTLFRYLAFLRLSLPFHPIQMG